MHEVDGIKPFLAHVDQQDAFKLGGKYYLVSDRELKGTSGIASIDRAEPYFNGKIVISVLPPYKVQITISEEKLSSFKLWLNY